MRARRAEPTLSLVTPEGVPLTFRLASTVERAAAMGLDLVLITIVTLLLGLAVFVVLGWMGDGGMALVFLAVFVVRHGYFIFFEIHWHGATLAKRLLGLRVVSRDGAGLSVTSVIARNLTRDVELFLPLAVLIGPEQVVGPMPWWLWLPAAGWVLAFSLLPVFTKERTRAGDLIAGTVVVNVPKGELFEDHAAKASANSISFSKAQLSVYGERELVTLADILLQHDDGKFARTDLATVAVTIAKKIGFKGPEPSARPLMFLESFYKQQRAELEHRLLFGQRIASKYARRR